MRELALFAGVGGGILGTSHLTEVTCAVEVDPFCQEVLKSHQRDGHLAPFPIWGDICAFDGAPWRGKVDIVTGGFPCQPYSPATHGRSTAKDFWPEMLRVVREVRPAFVFAENVTGRAIRTAASDCCRIGYASSIISVRACDIGAPHVRKRYWLLASRAGGDLKVPLPPGNSLKSDFWQTPPAGCVDGDPARSNEGQNYLERNFWPGFTVHTPTGAANFTAACMGRHPSCLNFVSAFGKKRPDPRILEWLMGLPSGWTRLSGRRGENQLRYTAIGNAQMPQMAAAALESLLESTKFDAAAA